MRSVFLFLGLLAAVLLVNFPVITFDMMYPEQPLIYMANQQIHSWGDLLKVYLHPQMFHYAIIFFRPSGHFLIYQLLAPILGWHNTQGFLVVNLIFLALTGWVLVRSYEELFPGFRLGGYLAFGLYLMHPALMLSRLILLHFEYAYVFFTLFSFYCFLLFSKSKESSLKSSLLFSASLFLYIVAVTFKEPALLLGPVLMVYALMAKVPKLKKVEAILLVFFLGLGTYLSMQWPSFSHPLVSGPYSKNLSGAGLRFLATAFGIQPGFFSPPVWRNVIFTKGSSLLLGFFTLTALLACLQLFFKTRQSEIGASLSYKKSLLFLFLAALIFFSLPLFWGWGLPWHLSLTLAFLCLIFGFGFNYLSAQWALEKKAGAVTAGLLLAVVGLTGLQVNETNIAYLEKEQGFALDVGHHAIFNPPDLQGKLHKDSIILVEDSILIDPYLLGSSAYPLLKATLASPNLDLQQKALDRLQRSTYLPVPPIYAGTLFKWAYLQPRLREEVFPFEAKDLSSVPDFFIYSWLREADKIICLGYDEQGAWHDDSDLFKKNLLKEGAKRKLSTSGYEVKEAQALSGRESDRGDLGFAAPQLCQYQCDQDKSCKGFTYVHLEDKSNALTRCYFYDKLNVAEGKACPYCEGYIKVT